MTSSSGTGAGGRIGAGGIGSGGGTSAGGGIGSRGDTGSGGGREALLRFLRTDEADVGCEETMRLLHVYVDLVLAGEDPERTHPGIAAHLRTCQPCIDDFDGLMRAVLAASRPGRREMED